MVDGFVTCRLLATAVVFVRFFGLGIGSVVVGAFSWSTLDISSLKMDHQLRMFIFFGWFDDAPVPLQHANRLDRRRDFVLLDDGLDGRNRSRRPFILDRLDGFASRGCAFILLLRPCTSHILGKQLAHVGFP